MENANKTIDWKIILRYAILALLFALLVLGGGRYSAMLCLGLAAACIVNAYQPIVVAAFYLASAFSGGFEALLPSGFEIVVLLIAKFIHYKLNKRISGLLLAVYLAAALSFRVIFQLTDTAELFQRLIGAGVAIAFAFVCLITVRALFTRGLRYRLGSDEVICLCLVAIVISSGINGIVLFDIAAIRIVASFGILFSLFVFGPSVALSCAAVCGIGAALGNLNLDYLAIFSVWAFFAVSFSGLNRLVSVVALLLSDVLIGYFFGLYSVSASADLIGVGIGCVIFLCFPPHILTLLSDKFGSKQRYSNRHIINRLRQNMSKRLYELGEIFQQMQLTFKSMTRGILPPERAKIAIAKEASEQVCGNCQQRNECWRTHLAETEESFILIAEQALLRGKATVIDVHSALASRCGRVTSLIGTISKEVASYKQHCLVTANADNGRLLIGEQLLGISKILSQLSTESKASVSFDTNKEKELMEELTFHNILTKEVVIYTDSLSLCVTLVIARESIENSKLIALASRICHTRLMVESVENTLSPNWVVAQLKPRPNFDITFGFVGIKKEGSPISGDTHSFMRINGDKFLLALCDGMGSGTNAEKASNTAISLIENFYKAGFDNDLILGSVNKLLSTSSEEIFTALDICVVDLFSGAADFIKIGAPCGLVKTASGVEYISSGSLPMGVLEEMKPTVTKKILNMGDFVVLFSDGVLDAYGDKVEIAKEMAINTLTNPQLIADKLMNGALALTNNIAKDDMTVIVAKIIKTAS